MSYLSLQICPEPKAGLPYDLAAIYHVMSSWRRRASVRGARSGEDSDGTASLHCLRFPGSVIQYCWRGGRCWLDKNRNTADKCVFFNSVDLELCGHIG